jgi:hypothetical protein
MRFFYVARGKAQRPGLPFRAGPALVPETFSIPFESVTLRVPVEGLNPLESGQLMVNVPLKFSAARKTRAPPGRTRVSPR